MRRSAIERLLPTAFQHAAGPGTVLAALLEVMEGMHAPSEQRLAAVADLFSPYRTPERFVSFLAGWVALDHVAQWSSASTGSAAVPAGRLRDLVAQGAALARWRGTATGLRSMLEAATGTPGFEVVEPADRPFHVQVHVPAEAASHRALIDHIVSVEKPAAATYELVLSR